MGLCISYGLSTDDWYVETTGINEWKHAGKYAVRNYAFQLLKSSVKKTRKLNISVLKKISVKVLDIITSFTGKISLQSKIKNV